MKKRIFILLVTLLSSLPALAEPTPVPVPRFSYWKNLWDQSKPATPIAMQGSWKLIAVATTANCSVLEDDALNENGFEDTGTLIFSSTTNRLGTSYVVRFQYPSSTKVQNQGPYVVNPNEPQFSLWGYIGRQTTDSYFTNFSCRFNPGNNNEIICSITHKILKTPPGYGAWDPDFIKCAKDPYQEMAVYSKK